MYMNFIKIIYFKHYAQDVDIKKKLSPISKYISYYGFEICQISGLLLTLW